MVLMAGFMLTRTFHPNTIPPRQPFVRFPNQIGPWHGHPQQLSTSTLAVIRANDTLMTNFIDPSGHWLTLYAAYHEQQTIQTPIHLPDFCIPANGWSIVTQSVLSISRPNHPNQLEINRLVIEKNNEKQLVYYWFHQQGKIMANPFQAKWHLFQTALTHERSDGALIRLVTSIVKSETSDMAEQRLNEFIQLLLPIIQNFIPE